MARKGEYVVYEWVVEEIDRASIEPAAIEAGEPHPGDIIECYYYSEDEHEQAVAVAQAILRDGGLVDFGLCYRLGSDEDGETDRQYAYCVRGAFTGLPEEFDGGRAVPKRFMNT